MMDSNKHTVEDGAGYHLPEQAWRSLGEIQAQVEFLAGLLVQPVQAHARLRDRLRDPRTLSLCLRVLGRQIAQVRDQACRPGAPAGAAGSPQD